MTGYTPVFGDIYTGTLYGRWPAAAVWASLLPLLDKNGCIDMSMQAICGMTGWPLELLTKGIAQLMEPDPHSRTPNHEGRRLILIDQDRPWGWQAVNHGKYREKARKSAYDQGRVSSGENAERMRARRDPPRPAITRADPLSDTDTDTDKKKEKRARATRLPSDFLLTDERRLVAEAERLPAERTFAKFTNHWQSASGARARKLDWDATWRNWCLNETDRKPNNGRRKNSLELANEEFIEEVRRDSAREVRANGNQERLDYGADRPD